MDSFSPSHFDALVFELDGTLTSISPWFKLAQNKGEENEVRETLKAIELEKITWQEAAVEMYQLLSPTSSELLSLADDCVEHLTQDTIAVLHLYLLWGSRFI